MKGIQYISESHGRIVYFYSKLSSEKKKKFLFYFYNTETSTRNSSSVTFKLMLKNTWILYYRMRKQL